MSKYSFTTGDKAIEAAEQAGGPEFLVRNMLPRAGYCILASHPKCGKTTFATQIAAAVAGGSLLGGQFPATQGQVLFLSLEESCKGIGAKLQGMASCEVARNIHVCERKQIPHRKKKRLPWLAEVLRDYEDVKLVVVDVLQKFIDAPVAYTKGYEAFAPLVEIAEARQVCILTLQHLKKSDRSPRGDVYGSNAVTGNAASIITLADNGLMMSRKFLYVDGRDVQQQCYELNRNDPTRRSFEIAKAPLKLTKSAEQQGLLDLLAAQGAPMSLRDLTRRSGDKSTANTRQLLDKLGLSGLVQQPRRGQYELTSQARVEYQLHSGPCQQEGGAS